MHNRFCSFLSGWYGSVPTFVCLYQFRRQQSSWSLLLIPPQLVRPLHWFFSFFTTQRWWRGSGWSLRHRSSATIPLICLHRPVGRKRISQPTFWEALFHSPSPMLQIWAWTNWTSSTTLIVSLKRCFVSCHLFQEVTGQRCRLLNWM